MSKKNTKNSFENNIHRLEEISSLLEGGDVELEDAIKLYEEGIKLSKSCLTTLKSAELKITELKKDIDNMIPDEELFEE